MIVLLWIDWYAYHVARLRALTEHGVLRHKVCGIEMVGGCGVHRSLKFRHSERGDLPVITLLPHADWRKARRWELVIEVWRKLGDLNPTHVFVPGYYNVPALSAAVWAKIHRKQSVLMCESTQSDRTRVWCKEALKRILVRRLFDKAIAGGKRQIQYLLQLGFTPEALAFGYDVVDNDFYSRTASKARSSSTREKLGLPEKYFLFAGRLAAEKNLAALLRSFAEYRATGGAWSLVLAGDGPLREELRLLAERSGIGLRVHFAGLKSSEELTVLYAFASCFVLPSVSEPWGLVVNEAMACGLPVIVSNRCGCVDDLVQHGANGFIFDPGRDDELTARLHRIAALSETALAAMGERSSEIIHRYSLEGWASEVARVSAA